MAQKPEARRAVYDLVGDNRLRIESVGRLDRAAYKAVFLISRL